MPDLAALLDEQRSTLDQIRDLSGRTLLADEQRTLDHLVEARSTLGAQIEDAAAHRPPGGRTALYVKGNFEARKTKVTELRSIDEAATGRAYTTGEKARIAGLHGELGELDSRISSLLEQEIRSARHASTAPLLAAMDTPAGGLGQAVLDAGFELRSHASVIVPLSSLELRASTFPAVTDLNRQAPLLSPLGQDARWLWPNLPRQDAGESASIQDFRQTVRTLTGTVKRALDAVTTKATVDTTTTLANEALSQFAVTIDDVPNQILESVPTFLAYMQAEGQWQVNKALDDHVLAQIVAAGPPFGTTGANLVERARNGIATMRATGANPSLLVVNPSDAATLDLLTDAGGYVFAGRTPATSNTLWGQTVVERIGTAGTDPPYLIDAQMLGLLYMGGLKFEADPYTGFKKNLTTLRIEGNALFHVRQAEGARRIAAT